MAVSIATVLAIIALALLPLLTPWFIHPALDAAGSAERLGVIPAEAHDLSDRSLGELLLGPGTFEIAGPDGEALFDENERAHLREARVLLWSSLAAGSVSIVGLGLLLRARSRRAAVWRTIGRAGLATTIVVILLGLISVVAFDHLFTLFHQVFFPGGNWAFDPSSQRLVQLYPFGFWQIAAGALGTLVALLGLVTWVLGRRAAGRAGGVSGAPADLAKRSGGLHGSTPAAPEG